MFGHKRRAIEGGDMASAPMNLQVYFTLKHARLASQNWRQKRHLRKLLAPFHEMTDSRTSSSSGGVRVNITTVPKVVDGRYLVFSTWTLLQNVPVVMEDDEAVLELCRHTYLMDVIFTLRLHYLQRDPPQPEYVTGHKTCIVCMTDIVVHVSPYHAVIHVWQDYGQEKAQFNPYEKARVTAWENTTPTCGAVRALYNR
ncbi:hypothetical protein TrVFT333_011645 [Trichoderma virens FT-333]|nr:hypothetical protein TrVFT333_011645 [Trichoderma virens FT-333]